MAIYIYKNEEQQGPFDPAEVQAELANGNLSPNDLAFQEGCADWVPLHSLMPSNGAPVSPVVQNISKRIEQKTDQLEGLVNNLLGDDQDPKVTEKVIGKATSLLTKGEQIEYIGVQKKMLINIAPDSILLTNKRFMIVRPKLMGMTFEDHNWREVANVHMSEQMMSATITCTTIKGVKIEIDSIPKKQARRIYAYAQEVEERMHEERRSREMEEKRAAAGGLIIQQPTTAANTRDDPLAILGKLKKMLDAGLIDSAEYESKKGEILSRM